VYCIRVPIHIDWKYIKTNNIEYCSLDLFPSVKSFKFNFKKGWQN